MAQIPEDPASLLPGDEWYMLDRAFTVIKDYAESFEQPKTLTARIEVKRKLLKYMDVYKNYAERDCPFQLSASFRPHRPY
jgi:hypothetical protein